MKIQHFGNQPSAPRRTLQAPAPQQPPAPSGDSVQLSRSEKIGKAMVYSSIPIGIAAGAALTMASELGMGVIGGLAAGSLVAIVGATIASSGDGYAGSEADDLMNPANPASPISPLNPANPASPIHWH